MKGKPRERNTKHKRILDASWEMKMICDWEIRQLGQAEAESFCQSARKNQ